MDSENPKKTPTTFPHKDMLIHGLRGTQLRED